MMYYANTRYVLGKLLSLRWRQAKLTETSKSKRLFLLPPLLLLVLLLMALTPSFFKFVGHSILKLARNLFASPVSLFICLSYILQTRLLFEKNTWLFLVLKIAPPYHLQKSPQRYRPYIFTRNQRQTTHLFLQTCHLRLLRPPRLCLYFQYRLCFTRFRFSALPTLKLLGQLGRYVASIHCTSSDGCFVARLVFFAGPTRFDLMTFSIGRVMCSRRVAVASLQFFIVTTLRGIISASDLRHLRERLCRASGEVIVYCFRSCSFLF